MNIILKIKNSIYNKEYYKSTVLTESLSQSIKYLIKLCLVASLVVVIFVTPVIFKGIKSGMISAVLNYPNDLSVSLNNGIASINQPEPYIVKIPDDLIKSGNVSSLKIDNLVVINTQEPFTLEKFREYSTLFLITKTDIVMNSSSSKSSEIKIYPLSIFGNLNITKDWLLIKEGTILRFLPLIIIAIALLCFIVISIVKFIGYLIFLLLYALIVWVVLKIKGINLSYKKSYQVAAHAITAILLFNLITLFDPLNNIFTRILIIVIILIINFTKEEKSIKNNEPVIAIEDEEVK